MTYDIEGGWVAFYWSLPGAPFGRTESVSVSHVRGTPVELTPPDLNDLEGVGADGSVVTSDTSGFHLLSPASGAIKFGTNPTGIADDSYNRFVAPSVRHLDGTWFFLIGDSLFEVRP
ncbi:MAG: hypothetical protein LOD94_08015 [Gammaproteobacteria bacterium]|nr:hypothetical protein [Gammaproteobacteria bacterium]